MNKKIVRFFDRAFYPSYTDRWDDHSLRAVILKYLKPEHTILDVGAGRGRIEQMNFKGIATWVDGIDPDIRVVENPLLNKGYEGLGDNMPMFEDGRFDIVFCDNVLEHVEHPSSFYQEVARTLKKGGHFISKTPNRTHYVPLIASITPTFFHQWVNKLRGRESSDTFPTFYRANSRRQQTRWGKENGLRVVEMTFLEGRPEYMRTFFFLYPFGLIYERIVNGLRLHNFKACVITVMVKE